MRIHVQIRHPTTQHPHVPRLVRRGILGGNSAQVRSSGQTICRKISTARVDHRSNIYGSRPGPGPESGPGQESGWPEPEPEPEEDRVTTISQVKSAPAVARQQQGRLRLRLDALQQFSVLAAGSGCSSPSRGITTKPSLTRRWFSWTGGSSSSRGAATSSPRRDSDSTSLPLSPHHDLASFVANARRTGLSPTSTVYTGTAYEYLALETLGRYGFDLNRIGGRGDRGVDLVGYWRIPRSQATDLHPGSTSTTANIPATSRTDTYRVLVQCKRLVGKHAKIGPNLIRELDGAVRGARLGTLFPPPLAQPSTATVSTLENGPPDEFTTVGESSPPNPDRQKVEDLTPSSSSSSPTASQSTAGPVVGVLVGTRPATKGVVESLRRSTRPLAWIMLEEVECSSSATSSVGGGTVIVQDEIDQENENENRSDLDLDQDTAGDGDLLSSLSRSSVGERASRKTTTTMAAPLKRGHIRQILWNQAARDAGLEGVDVVKRYRPRTLRELEGDDGDGEGEGEIEELVLTREGRVILGV